MPWFLCPRQAAGGVLALDAFRFARACFRITTVAGARALIDSLDTLSVFEAAVVDDRTRDWAERRVGGLELCTDNPVMDISWGTPY